MRVKIMASLYIVCGSAKVGGVGLVDILEAIKETGSMRLAAEKLGINYRRLWSRVKRAEKILGFKLVEGGRSGSKLTREAEAIIDAFRRAQQLLQQAGLASGIIVDVECGA